MYGHDKHDFIHNNCKVPCHMYLCVEVNDYFLIKPYLKSLILCVVIFLKKYNILM